MRVPPGASDEPRTADHAVIELMRVAGPQGIGALAASLGVTATAVRQRLDRLMRQGLVARERMGGRRGRPAHAYSLTEAGRRVGGDNFRDLSLVLWREIRGIRDPAVRRGLLGRVGAALADMHRNEVTGPTPGDRLEGVAAILQSRNISCAVEHPACGHAPGGRAGDERPSGEPASGKRPSGSSSGKRTSGSSSGKRASGKAAVPASAEFPDAGSGLSVLTSYACPYPDLAEQDRGICAAERLMIEELVGSPVRLTECRLDGGSCCRFAVAAAQPTGTAGGTDADLPSPDGTPRMLRRRSSEPFFSHEITPEASPPAPSTEPRP